MTAPRRILATAVSAAATLAAAAPAHAATITTLPCLPYVSGAKNMPISLSGFTPGSLVTVQSAPKGSTMPNFLTPGRSIRPATS